LKAGTIAKLINIHPRQNSPRLKVLAVGHHRATKLLLHVNSGVWRLK
jgi:hypothetical protein